MEKNHKDYKPMWHYWPREDKGKFESYIERGKIKFIGVIDGRTPYTTRTQFQINYGELQKEEILEIHNLLKRNGK